MSGIVRRSAGKLRRDVVLTSAIGALKRHPPGRMPSDASIMRVWLGWGNTTFSADFVYLKLLLERAVESQEPVLECGSGVSSLLLAVIAGRQGVDVHSLENDAGWARRVRAVLRRYGLPGHVHDTPIRSYGEFDWYDVPATLPDRFGLVACDGPHHRTKGGRYGLLPVMRQSLAGARILLDDAQRPGEQSVLERWRQEFGAESSMLWRSVGEVAVPAMDGVDLSRG